MCTNDSLPVAVHQCRLIEKENGVDLKLNVMKSLKRVWVCGSSSCRKSPFRMSYPKIQTIHLKNSFSVYILKLRRVFSYRY